MGKHDGNPNQKPPHVRTMHEGVTECDDPACCCEPEPRWRDLGEELELEAEQRSEHNRSESPNRKPA